MDCTWVWWKIKINSKEQLTQFALVTALPSMPQHYIRCHCVSAITKNNRSCLFASCEQIFMIKIKNNWTKTFRIKNDVNRTYHKMIFSILNFVLFGCQFQLEFLCILDLRFRKSQAVFHQVICYRAVLTFHDIKMHPLNHVIIPNVFYRNRIILIDSVANFCIWQAIRTWTEEVLLLAERSPIAEESLGSISGEGLLSAAQLSHYWSIAYLLSSITFSISVDMKVSCDSNEKFHCKSALSQYLPMHNLLTFLMMVKSTS